MHELHERNEQRDWLLMCYETDSVCHVHGCVWRLRYFVKWLS